MQRWAQYCINNHTFEAQGKIKNPSYAPFSDRPEEKGISSLCSSWYVCASEYYFKSKSLNSMYYICYWWEIFEDVIFIFDYFGGKKISECRQILDYKFLGEGLSLKDLLTFKIGMMVFISLTYHRKRSTQNTTVLLT